MNSNFTRYLLRSVGIATYANVTSLSGIRTNAPNCGKDGVFIISYMGNTNAVSWTAAQDNIWYIG